MPDQNLEEIPRQRTFRITAQKAPGAAKRVPKSITREYEGGGPTTALRKFRWEMEEKYGMKARDYFPGDFIVIEEAE